MTIDSISLRARSARYVLAGFILRGIPVALRLMLSMVPSNLSCSMTRIAKWPKATHFGSQGTRVRSPTLAGKKIFCCIWHCDMCIFDRSSRLGYVVCIVTCRVFRYFSQYSYIPIAERNRRINLRYASMQLSYA